MPGILRMTMEKNELKEILNAYYFNWEILCNEKKLGILAGKFGVKLNARLEDDIQREIVTTLTQRS